MDCENAGYADEQVGSTGRQVESCVQAAQYWQEIIEKMKCQEQCGQNNAVKVEIIERPPDLIV